MEIHTNRARNERSLEPVQAPDQSRYLRRNTVQKLRKSRFASRRLITVLRLMFRLAACIVALALGISLLMYAYNSSRFALSTVTVFGCSHLDAKKLDAVIRADCPANLLRLDLVQLRKLLEKQPWARRVEIRRVLPSELIVVVEERIPSVVLEMQGDLMLTDDDGVLLDHYDPRNGKLDVPVFKGVLGDNAEGYRLHQSENTARIQLGRRLLTELEAGSADYPKSISEIDISDKSNVKVTLVDDTAEIYLGDRDFLKRFRALMSNLPEYQELKSQYNEISVIDLRFDGNIVYRPKRTAPGHPVPAAQIK
ncbi:MAG TPA: FtsQ-type POTRA domain-containing protein [Acidobacteriota bacterium]|nr:FtsQ-type POTRA domain-containing protein [Acidobacteriota bacterium]